MNKLYLTVVLSCIVLLLSACSTLGSVAGAVIAQKTGNSAIVGSIIGGAAGQAIGDGALASLKGIGQ